jgi:hypothetical protein
MKIAVSIDRLEDSVCAGIRISGTKMHIVAKAPMTRWQFNDVGRKSIVKSILLGVVISIAEGVPLEG